MGRRARHVVWPSAVPSITTGLQVAVGRAIVGAVVAALPTNSYQMSAYLRST